VTNLEITCFENAGQLAEAAAGEWCRQIANLQHDFTVALSGGRIAVDFFRAIALQARPNAGIRKAHFFWADERCVPPDHAESSYRVAGELLFEPLDIERSRIHRICGEDEPARAAAAASEELLRITSSEATQHPVLDWVFLGMGEDGHVASLFPGNPPQEAIYYPVIGPKPPPQRITLSYRVLKAAREVWVLISGPGKEAALRESLLAGGTTPLAGVLKGREWTRIFSDIPV
jgi:6-phosphogluconolactonase